MKQKLAFSITFLESLIPKIEKKRQNLSKDTKDLSEEISKGIEDILMNHIYRIDDNDPLEKQVKLLLQDRILKNIKTIKEARDLLNQVLINVIFKQDQWKDLVPETQDYIRQIGMLQSSYDFRHFGGTEAIKGVQLKSIPRLEATEDGEIPCVVISVDRKHFENLNTIKVSEEGLMVGIGEYQIWRASDAYKSLTLGNTKIQLQVIDEEGNSVECIANKKIK